MTEEIKRTIDEMIEDYSLVNGEQDVLVQVINLLREHTDSLLTMLEERGVQTDQLKQDYNDQLEKLLKAGG